MTAAEGARATDAPAPGGPRVAYRVRLGAGFGFAEAAAIGDDPAGLGGSHLYTSPCLQATGSTHGYDVVDPTSAGRELGGAAGHAQLVEARQHHGLGLVLARLERREPAR